ncbi:hypothetical protein [Bacillus cereus group sp. BfR-BA-01455]|nr:hypothetical protein [Bacillus cereus group sp. BfR-BA-01455]
MDGLTVYLTVFRDILVFVGSFAPLLCLVVVLWFAYRMIEGKDK